MQVVLLCPVLRIPLLPGERDVRVEVERERSGSAGDLGPFYVLARWANLALQEAPASMGFPPALLFLHCSLRQSRTGPYILSLPAYFA